MKKNNCIHRNTYFDETPWPTGEGIEVCKDCGMSRAHWEQGESNWLMVDLEKDRKLLQECIDKMIKKPGR